MRKGSRSLHHAHDAILHAACVLQAAACERLLRVPRSCAAGQEWRRPARRPVAPRTRARAPARTSQGWCLLLFGPGGFAPSLAGALQRLGHEDDLNWAGAVPAMHGAHAAIWMHQLMQLPTCLPIFPPCLHGVLQARRQCSSRS